MRVLLAAVLCAGLVACDSTKITYGPEEVEEAWVEEVIYTPSHSYSGTGVGVSTSGNLVVSSASMTTDQKWVVVFRCQHGKFVVDSAKSPYAQNLWSRATKGSKVKIRYRQVLEDGVFTKFETLDVLN